MCDFVTRLTWNDDCIGLPFSFPGWSIEVFGICKELINFSMHGFLWSKSAPFLNIDGKSVGTGPFVWSLNPDKCAAFRKIEGAQINRPPTLFLTQCFDEFENRGFKAVESNSMSFNQTRIDFWFFVLN